ncbi:MAG: DEAD/DEAH box helicase [Candidatus Eisenbacteria bacterium]|nr:DEAD/DEAH box helicase [Candidatus Eisenbacteria bacterium]
MPFSSLGLRPAILKAIQEAGYTEPTPIQSKAIPIVLKGRDVIGTAQTGTGKTAAYVLPVIEKLAAAMPARHVSPAPAHAPARAGTPAPAHAPARPGSPAPVRTATPASARSIRVLVLVPTRELAVQVEDSVRTYAKHLPLQCAAVYGGVSEVPQIKALRARVDIIAATPGRLLDLMDRHPGVFNGLQVLILDEADRMLDMGFLPDIRKIVRQLPKERQTLLFSATFSDEIEKVSREFLRQPEAVGVGKRATPVDTVTQFVYEVSRSRKTPLLVHLLKDKGLDTVLVFTRTKRGADKLARKLENERVTVATLHSNKSQSQRQVALKGFKSGRYRVLVATDIAARGIDVDGISHVVNYDFPAAPEDYVHRIGRTGRAAAIGDALSFVTSEDHGELRTLERFIGRGIPRRPVDEAVQAEASEPRGERGPRQPQGQRGGRPGGEPGRRGDGGRRESGYGGGRPAQGEARRGGGGSGTQHGGRPGSSRPERPASGARHEGARSGSQPSGARRPERGVHGGRPGAARSGSIQRETEPEKPASKWGRLMERMTGGGKKRR